MIQNIKNIILTAVLTICMLGATVGFTEKTVPLSTISICRSSAEEASTIINEFGKKGWRLKTVVSQDISMTCSSGCHNDVEYGKIIIVFEK